MCTTACSCKQFYCKQRDVSTELQKKTKRKKSLRASSSVSAQRIPVHDGKSLVSRWERPHERESRKWLVPCSLRMSENVEISEKTAKILKNPKDRHEEDGARSWDKEPHHQPHAKDENHHSVQSDDTRAEIHRKRKIRNVLGPSHRWRKPHATFGYSLSKTKRGLFVHQSNTRTLREQEFNRVSSGRRPPS